MANFDPLTADIGWPVWSTPANFNGFRVLISLLHGTPVVGVSRTLRRWTEGATCIRQGDHHVGYWPTFLVFLSCFFYLLSFPRLISAVYYTSTDGVALVRISNPWHNFVGLYLCNEGTNRQSENNLLSSNMSSRCPHNMVNFGTLAALISWRVWGTLHISTGFASWQRYCTVLQ